jgi:hypothetical protein
MKPGVLRNTGKRPNFLWWTILDRYHDVSVVCLEPTTIHLPYFYRFGRPLRGPEVQSAAFDTFGRHDIPAWDDGVTANRSARWRGKADHGRRGQDGQ